MYEDASAQALFDSYLGTRFYCIVGKHFVYSVWVGCWQHTFAWWQLELDLEGPSSRIWREYGVDVEWFSKTEKNFSLKERKAHFLSLTQYSLGVELKFVECVNFCCWAWLKYAVTLKENPLNVTWFWWAWLKSLLTLIKNLLNVKTILLLEFCTIWLSILDHSIQQIYINYNVVSFLCTVFWVDFRAKFPSGDACVRLLLL